MSHDFHRFSSVMVTYDSRRPGIGQPMDRDAGDLRGCAVRLAKLEMPKR